MYRNYAEFLASAHEQGSLAKAVLLDEMELSSRTEEEIYERLEGRWRVMELSAQRALNEPQDMEGQLIRGQAQKQNAYAGGGGLAGAVANRAMALALSGSEVNASMGRICAAPTAGACGVLPAVLLAVSEALQADRRRLLEALLVAGGIGAIITQNATVSGAEGGCQAECGAAAAMAAGAAVVMAGGTDNMVGQAVSIALMNCMGLVCDPVAGLVQLPCSFRNASQAVNAIISADMALAGQNAVIPPDEAIDAMSRVGRSLPHTLKETSDGGVAASPTGQRLRDELKLGEIANANH